MRPGWPLPGCAPCWAAPAAILLWSLERNTEVQLIWRSRARTGAKLICEWHIVSLCNSRGGLMCLISIALDVPEKPLAAQAILKAKEEAEHLNTAKTEFLATISPELRTPLNSGLGMVQVIQLIRADDAELQDLVAPIRSGGARLHAIVEAILTYTSIALRKERPAEPHFLAREVCALLEERYADATREKGLACRFDYAASKDLALAGNRVDLEQLLIRLFDKVLGFRTQAVSSSAPCRTMAMRPSCASL